MLLGIDKRLIVKSTSQWIVAGIAVGVLGLVLSLWLHWQLGVLVDGMVRGENLLPSMAPLLAFILVAKFFLGWLYRTAQYKASSLTKLAIRDKIELLARHVYNADGAELTPLVERQIRLFEEQGWSNLPINMAKTSLSISHNPLWKNLPSGYVFPVTDIRPSVGAGFLYPLAGDMMTMPGLPSRPAAVDIDIDEAGDTVGLF